MYHVQGPPPDAAAPYQQSQTSQYPGYPPQPQVPAAQYVDYAAQQHTQQTQYGQYRSIQQPQPPGIYHSGPPYQAPFDNASPQRRFYQQKETYGSIPAHPAGVLPQTATSQSSIQSCYNCGCNDHWAQNCPEPRRAVPAGALNDSRPLKRQKTTGPIITRYPPPPGHKSQPNFQRSFTHPPAGHQAFPAPQGPPTPLSANGPSYNSLNPQQHPYVPLAPQQVNQQWTLSSVPTSTSSYGPHYASPVSANGTAQHQNYFNPQAASAASQGSPSRNNSYGSVGPVGLPTPSSFDSSSYPKPSAHSTECQSVSPDQRETPDVNGGKIEPWLEELQDLDFEGMKSRSGPIISHPVNPVAQALPADCATADAIGRLPIAASLPPGVPLSMYFRKLDEDEFRRNIREKAEWNEICNDPAFADIASDCDALSVSELLRRRNDEVLAVDGSDDEAKGSHYDTDSRDQYSDDERHEVERSYRRPETMCEAKFPPSRNGSRASNFEGKHSPRSVGNEQVYFRSRETEDRRLSREQEERLAALGVSGLPKPVQPSMRRTVALKEPPGPVLASPVESIDRQSRSTSLDKRAMQSENRDSPISGSLNGHSRDNSRERSHNDESPHRNGRATRASPRPHYSRENSYQDRDGREPFPSTSSYNSRHPPLPPPLPDGKQRCLDGSAGFHSSPNDIHNHDSGTDGYERSTASEDFQQSYEIPSPSRSRPSPHISRKRSYRHSSEESDDGPKRQEEENAQRRKRKHPKVADAYSRRW